VLEVACVGRPDLRLGQRPVAVVRCHLPPAERRGLVGRLRAAARAGLPAPARPARYAVVDDLPRTPAGKPDLGRLAERLADPRWSEAG